MSGMMNIGDTLLGHCKVLDIISMGGQAIVARGIDSKTGNGVAIKQLNVTPADGHYLMELDRFRRAGSLHFGHPNVVDPIECQEEDDQWYTIMPYIKGSTLDQYVSINSPLPITKKKSITMEVAHGLAAIHKSGVVHRDLKPTNIQIDPQGHPHILDLGICIKTNEPSAYKDNKFSGTLPWASPEHILHPGQEDCRSDLFSLGVILYWLLTGIIPTDGDSPAHSAWNICQKDPQPPHLLDRSIPRNLGDACMQLLAKLPENRFQTVESFLEAITACTGSRAANVDGNIDNTDFCISCGTESSNGAKYCHHCGAEKTAARSTIQCLACGNEIQGTNPCPNCHRHFGNVRHLMTFKTGTLAGRIFQVPEGTYEIGRNSLCPRDQHISRKHLRILCLNGSVSIEDLGSANRTYVGGLPVNRLTSLADGLELCIAGNTGTYTSS